MKRPLLTSWRPPMMAAQWLLGFLLSGFPLLATAQCPTGDVTLSTQAQVDAFPPGCTNLNGRLTVSGQDITNLNGLQNLQTVEGNFEVLNNPKLSTIDGLNALTQVGDYNSLKINNNDALLSINGLQNLQTVAANVEIQNNPQLASLTGLNALTSVGSNVKLNNDGFVTVKGLNNLQTVELGLEIQNNPQLASLDGLGALIRVGRSIYISNNAALTSVNGLNKVQSVGNVFEIQNNPQLTSLNGLTALTSIGESARFSGNGALLSIKGFTKLQMVGSVFEIQDNPKLTSIEGLTALTSVNLSFRLNNDGLTSLQGLNKLQTVGGTFEIQNNTQLTSLTALMALTQVTFSLKLINNGALTSLQGLNNLQAVGAFLIQNNPKLAACALSSICQLITDKQIPAKNVFGNAPGCSSLADIQADCAPLVITSQPPSGSAVCPGASVTATVSVSGNARRFQWYQNGSLLESQTTATLNLTSVQVGQSGAYQVVVSNSVSSLTATAFRLTVSMPSVSITPSTQTVCQGQSASFLAQGANTYVWSGGQTTASISVSVAGPYSVTGTTNGCSATATAALSIAPLPSAPSLLTQSGYPYPTGQSSLTLSQDVGPVSLTVIGCSGGILLANGTAASSFTISTVSTGTQTYTATCAQGGCTGPAGSFQLTVVPTTLSVLHRDADYGQLTNNIIKPFLELSNAGGSAIPYGEVTVRYWFTAEGNAPSTNLAVYYAQLGVVNMQFVALAQPRQGAYGYVEYSFPGGGSLAGGGNSGPIETGIQKTDGSNFNESDDYSYAAHYADYVPNSHITAYRKGADGVPVIVYGQEPTAVSSQTAVAVYSATKDEPTTSQIQPRLELRNTGNVALPVANLKLRYYFTSDNNQPASVYVDYADIGAQNVQAQVVRLGSPVNGADSYVELSFPDSPLTLNSLSSLGVIDFRLVRSDYGLFDQTNDYSYTPSYGNVGLNNHITAYLHNSLVFGTPPNGVSARVAAREPGTSLQVKVLGNPMTGSQAQVEIRGVKGQAVTVRLIDLQGRAIHEQGVDEASEVELVSVPLGQSRGTLLLGVNTASQQQLLKLLRP